MTRERLADTVVGTIGDAAGTVVDPKEGLSQARRKASVPTAALVGIALIVGYLLGRRARG
ncbi:hypothetical protein [Plantactinospora sp. KBS50]|uniref:hypothetical protein n=1 Tax=Plantactinospora sp. KBS50 TaxID=2024580 RepID=UPI000BAAD9DB|nr:hypothetical protein [Plantactinospora sp. KBS50]ASW55234.1 hypothetical protein CIK06_15205 [Plantactinospora sp. KBS50]